MIAVPDEILSEFAETFDTQKEALTYLGGGRHDSDGISYTYARDGEDHVLKILAFSANDVGARLRLEARLQFVHFLGDRGAPIVYPLEVPEVGLYATRQMEENLFTAYTYRKIKGGVAGEVGWFDTLALPWGAAVGMMHRLAQAYPTWQYVEDRTTGQQVLGWREEWQGFYDWCQDPDVRERWVSIRSRLEALPIQRDSFGFIHNDPHAHNILITERGIALLDFDVANCHWFINDIAIALQTLLFKRTGGLDRPLANREPLRKFLDDFMQGYCLENALDPTWLDQIDLFIAYRRILMFTVQQQWMDRRPALRRTMKQLILEEPPILGPNPIVKKE